MSRRNKNPNRVLRRVGLLGLAAIVLLQLILIVPRLFGMELFAITSGSMEPEIPTGSVVYAEKTEPETLQTGDIIVFESGADGGFVTHRVVRNDRIVGEVVTKGDTNAVEDPMPVGYGQICGRVRWHFPLLGFAVSRRGKMVCAVFIIVLLGLMATGRNGQPQSDDGIGDGSPDMEKM